jgi:phosphoglycolate phosphatase
VPSLILFDLDGTLVDSAPDLAASANALRAARGLPPLPLAQLRPHVGSGARGMLGAGLGLKPGDAEYEALRLAFLADYATRLLDSTTLFDGIADLLSGLPRFGIVTNKALALAHPIQQALAPLKAATVLIGGDSTPHRKPHPAPLLAACAQAGVAPADALYIGDDLRDMQAARAAGMPGWAVRWGYLGDPGEAAPIEAWGADRIVDSPSQLRLALGA